MKKLQKYMPILLVLLMTLSAYKLMSDKIGNKSEYKKHIKNAENYYQEGIIVDAASEIDKAIEMKPTIDLYIKKGKYFYKSGLGSEALSIADTILDKYPKDTKSYDFALYCYLKFDNFVSCYDILDNAEKRNIKSKKISEVENELKYKFFLEGKNYEKIGALNSNYYSVQRKGLWGYSNAKGSKKIDYYFITAGPFVNSLAPVSDENGAFYINEEGYKKVNIPPELKCQKAGPFVSEKVALQCNNKYGFYNSDFKHLFGEYDYASTMYNSVAAVKNGNQWFLINDNGKQICKSSYSDVKLNELEIPSIAERLFLKNNGKYVLSDLKCNQISDQLFDDCDCFNDNTLAAVCINGKWGFINTKGEVVIKPAYEKALSFSNGLAAVCLDGKWGYIDASNNIVIECQFAECFDMNKNGCTFVKENHSDDKYSVLKLYKNNH